MSFCGKCNDVVLGSSSSGWREGEEENADTVCTLREEVHKVKKEFATLKGNMATIVKNQVENMVNNHLPTLTQSIENWRAAGRQGTHPKYHPSSVELAPSQGNVVSEPTKPAA
jgi:hypothetical protein